MIPSLLLMAAVVTNGFSSEKALMLMNTNTIAKPDLRVLEPSTAKTILTFPCKPGNNFEYDYSKVEVTQDATNLVFHTKLKPVVTQTNGTYYIKFESNYKEIPIRSLHLTTNNFMIGPNGERYSLAP